MNLSVRLAPLAVPEPNTVPEFSALVIDQSTELNTSPGNSQTPKLKLLTLVPPAINESLTM